MDDELIRAHGDVPQLMPFLHLPVQSGSDAVLAAMNRSYTADDYRRVVDALRAARPDLALSSDFIVGFPGESDADFAATMRLVEEIGFAQAFSFKYSAAARARRRPALRRQVAEAGEGGAAGSAAGSCSSGRPAAFNAACVGADPAGPARAARAATRASWSAARPISRRSTSPADGLAIGDLVPVEITALSSAQPRRRRRAAGDSPRGRLRA